VMMTAVSFIIGVLALILGSRGGGPTPPLNGPTVFTGQLVAPRVGLVFNTARFVLFQPQPDWGHRRNDTSPNSHLKKK
ncbi:hypothetical protein ACVGXN_02390, partial [Enterobacter hormaechei]